MSLRNYKILFIFWSIVILTLTSIPKLKTPADELFNIDKIAHFGVYLIFAYLFIKMHLKENLNKTLRILWILAIIVPIFDEVHQIPIPGREFSFWDIIADFLGFLAILLFFTYRKNPKSKRNKS